MSESMRKRIAELENSPIYWAENAKNDFSMELCSIMEEQGVSRSELARRIGVSPAYITKALGGTMNFSIESMSKLAFAVGAKIGIKFERVAQFNNMQTNNIVRNSDDTRRITKSHESWIATHVTGTEANICAGSETLNDMEKGIADEITSRIVAA